MKLEGQLLPFFDGFYGTYFDIYEQLTIVDTEEEIDEVPNGILQEDYDNINFIEGYKKLASNLVRNIPYDYIFTNLGMSIVPNSEKLVSPRFYNYSNDEIYVDYNISSITIQFLQEFLENYGSEYKAYIEEKGMQFNEDDFEKLLSLLRDSEYLTELIGVDLSLIIEAYIVTEYESAEDIESDWLQSIDIFDYI